MDQAARLKKEKEHLEKAFRAGILHEDEYLKAKRRIDDKLMNVNAKKTDDERKKKVISDIINKSSNTAKTSAVKTNPIKTNIVKNDVKKAPVKLKKLANTTKNTIKKVANTTKPKLKEPSAPPKYVKKQVIEDIFVEEEKGSNFWSYLFLLVVVILILFFVYQYTSGLVPVTKTVTITEYSDFQCTYCFDAQSTLMELKGEYLGRVKIIHKHFPIESHDTAMAAAVASECANEQNAFLDYHNLLYKNMEAQQEKDLIEYAHDLDLNVEVFTACLDDPKMLQNVFDDIEEGKKMGVTVIPTFFVGEEKLVGAQPLKVFKYYLNKELKK